MTTNVLSIGLKIPGGRQPRKRRSEAPRQPHIRIGMEVGIVVPCELRHCRGWRHGQDLFYRGVIEQKRGPWYLVVTRIYGSFWVQRKHMYGRDHNGRTWTTPLLVTNDPV